MAYSFENIRAGISNTFDSKQMFTIVNCSVSNLFILGSVRVFAASNVPTILP